jgi:hypothetical protein
MSAIQQGWERGRSVFEPFEKPQRDTGAVGAATTSGYGGGPVPSSSDEDDEATGVWPVIGDAPPGASQAAAWPPRGDRPGNGNAPDGGAILASQAQETPDTTDERR